MKKPTTIHNKMEFSFENSLLTPPQKKRKQKVTQILDTMTHTW